MENRLFKASALALVLLFTGQFASAMNVKPGSTTTQPLLIEEKKDDKKVEEIVEKKEEKVEKKVEEITVKKDEKKVEEIVVEKKEDEEIKIEEIKKVEETEVKELIEGGNKEEKKVEEKKEEIIVEKDEKKVVVEKVEEKKIEEKKEEKTNTTTFRNGFKIVNKNVEEKKEDEVKEKANPPSYFSLALGYLAMPFVGGYNLVKTPVVGTCKAVRHPVDTTIAAYNYLTNLDKVAVAQENLRLAKKSLGELFHINAELAFDLIDASGSDWTQGLVDANLACAQAGKVLFGDNAEFTLELTEAETALNNAKTENKATAQVAVNNAALKVIKVAAQIEEDEKNKADVAKFQDLLYDRNLFFIECADSIKEIKHKEKVDKNPEVVGNEAEYKAFHDAFTTEEYKKAYDAKVDAENKLSAARHWMYVGTKDGVKNAALATVKFPMNHYWITAGVAGVAALGVTYALLTGRSVPGVSFVTSKIGSLFKNNPKVQEILQKQLVKKLA